MTIPIPNNEKERLQALLQYDVLDTEAEQLLDDLTQLAAHICNVPISLISLIDADRQWFKSRVGLAASETPREFAFCAHAIMDQELFVVPNAVEDQRFAQNPLVTGDPDIRFYAGLPLQTPTGYNIGTLCVIDRIPRELTETQKKTLAMLGRQVIAHLEMRLKNKALQEATEKATMAQKAAQKATEAKSEFLANMSHEIRTPLNAVIGITTLLDDTSLTDQQEDLVQTIRYSGELLLTVINNVLDFSKIEAGKLQLDTYPFLVQDCVDSALRLLAVAAAKKDIKLLSKLDKTVPAGLLSDKTHLQQVLVNLLSNAVKFTHQGEVVLSVTARELEKPDYYELHFVVKDTGIGIPAGKQDHLFQPFSQADNSTTRKYGGTGLGLSISKKIVEQMNGRIWFESKENLGTSFHFTITAQATKLDSPPDSTNVRSKMATKEDLSATLPRQVLLVEDNLINQKLASLTLERLGCEVDLAANGQEAIDALKRQSYDAVLMDVHMPVLDGLEATKQIRLTLPAEEQPFIIALTANATAGHRQICLDAGMDDYISKPFQLDELLTVLQNSMA